MSLVINHNMMAMNTARNLSNTYDRLSSSVQRLSSGLRINSAADDAAGLAIRELMRADISTMQQGIRNAADAISMIQTADGAMAVIDEKLTRMKELAEQAATGTYTTLQREIINSEYQAMAAEIDRIANATNFNGVKLLDGSITTLHGGQGMKIHFGVGNSADEDYYFINTGDVRATSSTGLRIGGDAKNDIWGQGAAGAKGLAGPGCCTAGYDSLGGVAGFKSGDTFAYGYNWDWMEDDDPDLLSGKYLAGRYTVNSSDSLQDLIDKVNLGTQSRVGVKLDGSALAAAIKAGGTAAVCVGDEAYIFGSASIAGGTTVIPPVEGIVSKYLAEGSYTGNGFMYNKASGYMYGLTQAQISYLQSAGIDLTALGLASAIVVGSGSSLVNSAQARVQLISRLNSLWSSLDLNGLSALTTMASAYSGFEITSSIILASAAASTLNGTGITATIGNNQTLLVHTGVYADANGNWTDDKFIASALNLQEITIEFKNNAEPTYTHSLTNYTSDDYYVTGDNKSTNPYVMNATTHTAMTAAGISLSNYNAATLTGTLTATADSFDAASAALATKIEEAWLAKYENMAHQLTFSVGTAPSATAPQFAVTAAEIVAANSNITAGTDSIPTTESITVTYSGIWVDSNGNWTSSQTVATHLNFSNLAIVITENNGEYTAEINGATFTGAPFDTTYNSTNIDTLAPLLNQVANEYFNAMTGSNANIGQVSFDPQGQTTPAAPVSADYSGVKSKQTVVPSANSPLEVTVHVAGNVVTTPAALTSLSRSTTTIENLMSSVSTGISQLLNNYQLTAAGKNLKGMGRIVKAAGTPPGGPNGITQVNNLTQSSSFYSGVLDRSIATGKFSDSGYVFNSGVGYGLTSAQSSLLHKAGLDLSQLLLNQINISGSASSTISSASARQLLVTTLNDLFLALSLGDLSAITITSGDYTSFTPLSAAHLTDSAINGSFTGIDNARTLNEQHSFIVHTGIYADANGNWTHDKTLAEDLGLEEITYTIQNNDYTWYTASITGYTNTAFWDDGTYLLDTAMQATLTTAGLTLPATFTNSNIGPIMGSAITQADALVDLEYKAQDAWHTKYTPPLTSLKFEKGVNADTLPNLTLDEVTKNATSTNSNGQGATNNLNIGSSITVSTGYYGAAGSWTTDSALAAAFSLPELTYTVTNTPSGYVITLPSGTALPADSSITNYDELTTKLSEAHKQYIRDGLTTNPDAGRISTDGQNRPTAPNIAALQAGTITETSTTINTVFPNDPTKVGILQVFASLAGTEYPVLTNSPPGPMSVTSNITQLTNAINSDLERLLRDSQYDAKNLLSYSGMGRLEKVQASTPQQVTQETQIEDLNTNDIWKTAAGQQTVTTVGIIDKTKFATLVASAGTATTNASGISNFGAWALASAINHNATSKFWAMVQNHDSNGNSADMVYIFAKDGGDNNSLLACDVADGDVASQLALNSIEFENPETGKMNQDGTNFSLGGLHWGTFKPVQTRAGQGKEVWNLTIHGLDVGQERDLWIAAVTNGKNDIETPGLSANIINGLDRYSFVEIQNAANGQWAGAEVRTQSSAQEALDAINEAMERKDKVRADIGALQNRLENTITNLQIQVEALQASESRISDVDIATEMTEFVRNQVLAQAAVSMLSQANSLPQMALSLLNG